MQTPQVATRLAVPPTTLFYFAPWLQVGVCACAQETEEREGANKQDSSVPGWAGEKG